MLKVSTLEFDLHTFGDADKDVFSTAVYSMEQYVSGISLTLLCLKSQISKQELMIAKLELFTCPMPVNLLVKVKKALVGYPVNKSFS